MILNLAELNSENYLGHKIIQASKTIQHAFDFKIVLKLV